jgi:hypothetical protein
METSNEHPFKCKEGHFISISLSDFFFSNLVSCCIQTSEQLQKAQEGNYRPWLVLLGKSIKIECKIELIEERT